MTIATESNPTETKNKLRKFSIMMTSFMIIVIIEDTLSCRVQHPLIQYITFHIIFLLVSLIGYMIYKLLLQQLDDCCCE
ncbi:hypothetical protein [Bacillus massiliigorillae]|uniref:hypothetical protein n=1 Tax=Bacillus massiliigorillae TaxID=1243664 RepID=UPI0005A67977|nr:hypothetical protein [Bacillus massiliigorillae]